MQEEPYEKDDRVIRAYCQEILSCLREVTSYDRSYGQQIQLLAEQVDSTNPAELADLVAAIVSNREGAQRVLEELDVKKRLALALTHLKTELETSKIRSKLAKLATLEPSGSEFNVTRTYLDWLTQLPWGKFKARSLLLCVCCVILNAVLSRRRISHWTTRARCLTRTTMGSRS